MRDALIVGAGRGVWEDIRSASAYLKDPEVFAINLMIPAVPVIHHAVSHHADCLADLVRYRKRHARLKAQPFVSHSSYADPEIDRVWADMRDGDSSLLAARIAVALGSKRVILAGVPLDGSGHVYDDPVEDPLEPAYSFTKYRQVWERYLGELTGRVFSMSGATRELLGAPA